MAVNQTRLLRNDLKRKHEKMKTYPNASFGGFSIGISNAGDSVKFFVEEHNIGDVSNFGTFLTDVLFNFEYSCRIFLQAIG